MIYHTQNMKLNDPVFYTTLYIQMRMIPMLGLCSYYSHIKTNTSCSHKTYTDAAQAHRHTRQTHTQPNRVLNTTLQSTRNDETHVTFMWNHATLCHEQNKSQMEQIITLWPVNSHIMLMLGMCGIDFFSSVLKKNLDSVRNEFGSVRFKKSSSVEIF